MNATASAYMLLSFPAGFNITAVTCQSVYGLSVSACASQSSQVLRVTGLFPNTDVYSLLSLSRVGLPGYVGEFPITVQVLNGTNGVIGQSTALFAVSTTPGSLAMTIQSVGSTTAGDITGVQFSIVPADPIPQNGNVKISLPKWNPGTQDLQNVQSMIQYSAASDRFIVGQLGYQIDCSSSAHPSLVCTVSPANPLSVSAIPASIDVLTVSGLSTTLQPGVTLSLQLGLSRFRNPPSTKPVTTIAVTSFTGSQQIIGSSTSASYQASQPANVQQVLVTPAATKINDQTSYDFQITLPLPLQVGATIRIGIPLQIGITAAGTSLLYSAAGSSPLYQAPHMAVVDPVNQIIELTGLIPSS